MATEQLSFRPMGVSMVWSLFSNGQSLGATGTENGLIVRDEEHSAESRITLERGGYGPFAITCGIYGVMVHTTYASSEEEAMKKYETMKRRTSLRR